MMDRQRIARRFGAAAASYDEHSGLQRHAAQHLAELIAASVWPQHPRILEIGCGTGHLTAALNRRITTADFLATDIAPAMVAACRQRMAGAPHLRYAVMDGERPAVAGEFDLVCSNLAAQWFGDLGNTLSRCAALLAPGGVLAMAMVGAGTFAEWRTAHRTLGLTEGTPDFPSTTRLRKLFPATGEMQLTEEHRIEASTSPLDFLRALRAIGADTPTAGHRALSAGELRRVLKQLGDAPSLSYRLLYALWRKPRA